MAGVRDQGILADLVSGRAAQTAAHLRKDYRHVLCRITDCRFSGESALKGFRREYRARRQTAQAAHALSGRRPGRPEWAAESRDGCGQGLVRLQAIVMRR